MKIGRAFSIVAVFASALFLSGCATPQFIFEQKNNFPKDDFEKTYRLSSVTNAPKYLDLVHKKLQAHGWREGGRNAVYHIRFNHWLLEGAYPDNPHAAWTDRSNKTRRLADGREGPRIDVPVDVGKKGALYTTKAFMGISRSDFHPGQKKPYEGHGYLLDYETNLDVTMPQLIDFMFECFPGVFGESEVRRRKAKH